MPERNERPCDEPVEIDSDVDLRVPGERDELRRPVALLLAIAIGGMLGGLGRFTISEAWPMPADAFPWPTLVVNATGCFALGMLMAFVLGRPGRIHPLTRPAVGTGLVGGYTSFSSYAVEVHHLLIAHRPVLGLAYLAASVIVGVAAVVVGRSTATRASGALDTRRRDRT